MESESEREKSSDANYSTSSADSTLSKSDISDDLENDSIEENVLANEENNEPELNEVNESESVVTHPTDVIPSNEQDDIEMTSDNSFENRVECLDEAIQVLQEIDEDNGITFQVKIGHCNSTMSDVVIAAKNENDETSAVSDVASKNNQCLSTSFKEHIITSGGMVCDCEQNSNAVIDEDSLREGVRESLEYFYSAQDFLEYGSFLTTASGELRTPDIESGYFEKSESDHSRDENDINAAVAAANITAKHSSTNNIAPTITTTDDHQLSEGLRTELIRFKSILESIENQHMNNRMENRKDIIDAVLVAEQNLIANMGVGCDLGTQLHDDDDMQRGYWSTVFGQASQIECGKELTLDERCTDIQKAHRALELLEDYHSRLSEPQDRALRIAIERVIRIFKSRLFQALLARDFMQAYRFQAQCIQAVVKMLQQLKEENWCLPIMYTVCLDLRILAQKCEELGKSSKPGEILEKAADCLMSCFRVCAADNRSSDDDTKRLGMLNLVNQLFKVYFRINKLHLCKPLIRAIDSSAFKDSFPLPEQITYKYFVGRKAMFDSDYKSADEFLSFALKNCPRNFPRNKRLILIYLVPVKMLLGYMPTKEILERYDVLQFHELATALKEGNVRKFDEVIQKHEIFFIKCGIYLLVEKLKFIVYRNLFKRVYLIKQTHQLDLADFRAALQFVGESDMSIDETHCIVANLIFEGKIKGYISHSHNKLVVSKQNPFPPLNMVS